MSTDAISLELDPNNLLHFIHSQSLGNTKMSDLDREKPDKFYKYETYYQNPEDKKQVWLLKETIDTLNKDDFVIHRYCVSHQYTKTGDLISTTETEYALIVEPGAYGKQLKQINHRVTPNRQHPAYC